MEASLLVVCECASAEQRDVLLAFLDRDTRPVLDEEVAPKQRKLYAAVEHTEYPEWVAPAGERGLRGSWLFGIDFEEDARDLLRGLLKAGVLAAYGFLSEDEYAVVLEAKNGRVAVKQILEEDDLAPWAEDDAVFANLTALLQGG